jgi:PIN domain nuclease of toxin-antitoxin system
VIVVDTHTWLWWCDAPKRLSRKARLEIERAATVGVSTMSCWELTMLERRNRLRFDRGSSAWIRQALGRERTVLLPVTVDVAIRGGTLQTHIPDPADGLIYATAVEHGATLVSRDARLQEHDPDRVIW